MALGQLPTGLVDGGDFGPRHVDSLRERLLVKERLQSLLVVNDARHFEQEPMWEIDNVGNGDIQ